MPGQGRDEAGCPPARLSPAVPLQVTSYGGELRYTVTHRAPAGARPLPRQPDVLLQGNGILLEHFADAEPTVGVPTTVTVPFREVRSGACPPCRQPRGVSGGHMGDVPAVVPAASLAAGGRARGHPRASPDGLGRRRPLPDPGILHGATGGEQVLGAGEGTPGTGAGGQGGDGDTSSRPRRLAEVSLDVAVPHATGRPPALEVEDCTCPAGYRGASCQVRPSGAPRPRPWGRRAVAHPACPRVPAVGL